MTCPAKGVAIFGGTFDPVHFGHLRSAVEVGEALGVEKVKLIPSCLPPHRDRPGTTPMQRLEMLRLATRNADYLEVDEREIAREGKSYMVETLVSLRKDVGGRLPLMLVLGHDAWAILDTWHDWRRLTDLAHIVVLDRDGNEPPVVDAVRQWSMGKWTEEPVRLRDHASGMICRMRLTRLDISATRIREIIRTGRSPDYLMPREVIEYIRQEQLYR